MTPPRNWLCLITSDREFANVEAMTRDIWTHFDGICAVIHDQAGDPALAGLLEQRCGAGFVETVPWRWHHGHSMNHWLFDKRIHAMDACWIRDSSERFNPAFSAHLKAFSADLLAQNVWNLGQHSKLLMFRRWYGQQFVNGLHWGLMGLTGPTISMEQLPQFADDRACAYSVRNETRPFDHRYLHEVRYLIDYGLNGNHLALFHGTAAALEQAQEQLFHFTQHLDSVGVHTAEQLIVYLKTAPMESDLRRWLNNERPFRNLYRYHVLGHTDAAIKADEDTWRIM